MCYQDIFRSNSERVVVTRCICLTLSAPCEDVHMIFQTLRWKIADQTYRGRTW